MKLIIQIPCYNEEETLKVTLDDLPKHISGVLLVIVDQHGNLIIVCEL